MKKLQTLVILFAIFKTGLFAQTNSIVNFDFNSVSSYPVAPIFTETGIICSGTSTEAFQTYSGVATTAGAFLQNTTAGNSLAMANSNGTNTRSFVFQLGGSDLNTYQSYKLYFQAQRSSTGASVITVAYSTNGTTYTNLATTYNVTTSFSDVAVDLSAISAINASSSVYIKLMASGASSTGTLRIDNFEVQATKIISGGGSGNGWTQSGTNVTTPYNVGIGTTNPAFPLDVVGNTNIAGNLTSSGSVAAANLSLSSLTGTGNRSLFVNSTGGIFASSSSSSSSANSCIPGAPQWSIGGDNISGLSLANKSIGTCDNTNFVLKSNNIDRVWIRPDRGVGIGTSDPMSNLAVMSTVADTTYAVLRVGTPAANGLVSVNGKGEFEIRTATWNPPGKPFKIISDDDDLSITSEVFSVGKEGHTRILCPNTTVAKPAFSVQGIDLTADYQDRLGSTFKIYGNQNGDVSSSADLNLYCGVTKTFRVFDGNASDGSYNGLGANATLNFRVARGEASLPGMVEIGGANMYANTSSSAALRINTPTAFSKAISVYPWIGATVASAENFVVFNDGRTAVGDNYVPAGYKLAVNGKIIAEEVVVQFRNTWPDYVFRKDYQLKPLKEVEQYIAGHKHLENIPSAKEIETDGVKLGNIVSKQMEKIEELTLYLIEQQKQIENLKKEVESLKK